METVISELSFNATIVNRLKELGYSKFLTTDVRLGNYEGRNFIVRGWAVDDDFEYQFTHRFPKDTTIIVYEGYIKDPSAPIFSFAPILSESDINEVQR